MVSKFLNVDTDVTLSNNSDDVVASQRAVKTYVDRISPLGGVGVPLLTPLWQDHLLNNLSWLRSDTFAWQSGLIYTAAYQHLSEEIVGITAQTECIAGVSITFYQANDGHKIVLADQENNVASLYAATGIAWYYILDIENTLFKLPRSKWNFVGYRNGVGNYVAESLPNITGRTGSMTDLSAPVNDANSALYWEYIGKLDQTMQKVINQSQYSVNLDASRSSSAYQNGASVQQRATEMYLYFYVGQFTQTAIEQTAGINAETLNGKADKTDIADKVDITSVTDLCMPDYAKCIAGGVIGAGTWTQAPKDSQVVVWGTDPYMENFGAFVSPDSGQTQYQVGQRYDDTNGNTEGTSFCFLVPKNWYFTCQAEHGYSYRIYPLKGAV